MARRNPVAAKAPKGTPMSPAHTVASQLARLAGLAARADIVGERFTAVADSVCGHGPAIARMGEPKPAPNGLVETIGQVADQLEAAIATAEFAAERAGAALG